MNTKIYLLLLFISISCSSNRNSFDLLTLSNNYSDTIDYLNLSNKKISIIPNMKNLKVKKINLSNNKIKKVDFSNLPRGLEELDLSNNRIAGELVFEYELKDTIIHYENMNVINKLSNSKLRLVNLSNNKIGIIDLPYAYSDLSINLSNNEIHKIYIHTWAENKMDTLILTNNKFEYKPNNSVIGSKLNYVFRTVIDD